MLKHLSILSLFISVAALADLNGTYQGAATYTDTAGQAEAINLNLGITVTPTELKLTEVGGWLLISSLEIQGTSLMFNGAAVGTITETGISVKDLESGGVKYSLDIALNGTDLTVKDAAVYEQGSDGIEGTLQKVARVSRNFAQVRNKRWIY